MEKRERNRLAANKEREAETARKMEIWRQQVQHEMLFVLFKFRWVLFTTLYAIAMQRRLLTNFPHRGFLTPPSERESLGRHGINYYGEMT